MRLLLIVLYKYPYLLHARERPGEGNFELKIVDITAISQPLGE